LSGSFQLAITSKESHKVAIILSNWREATASVFVGDFPSGESTKGIMSGGSWDSDGHNSTVSDFGLESRGIEGIVAVTGTNIKSMDIRPLRDSLSLPILASLPMIGPITVAIDPTVKKISSGDNAIICEGHPSAVRGTTDFAGGPTSNHSRGAALIGGHINIAIGSDILFGEISNITIWWLDI